jgi:hypothetical protein
MNAPVKLKAKEIDFKSLMIGFLLAAVLFLGIGAYAGSGTQDVRIVGVSTYDNLRVKIERIDSSAEMKVNIHNVGSSLKVPVRIEEIRYNLEVPVKIEDQPIEVKTR